MNELKYYKSTNQEVIQACLNIKNETERLEKEWSIWVEQFKDIGKVNKWFSVARGIDFRFTLTTNNPPRNLKNGFWSKPIQGESRLLSVSNKIIKNKEVQQAMIDKFNQHPQSNVSYSELYKKLGVDWQTLLLNGFGQKFDFENNVMYFTTCANLKNCEEITASEFKRD